ncbi:MAG: nuclear transport factor 2 family protein [Ferruginibacter sp.]
MNQLKSISTSLLFGFVLYALTACNTPTTSATMQTADSVTIAKERNQINALLDSFNRAAAQAQFDAYFNFYTEDAIFAGTDATERWIKKDFMVWAKPFFDKGKAWNFTALERHIYFDKTAQFAWFDELLNTQMKICRGSGVLIKNNNEWKIQQYILSTTVPNDQLDSVISIKATIEDELIQRLSKK